MIKMKNIPNTLTISRILACPIWFTLVFFNYHTSAFILVIIILFTDYLDGFLARELNNLTVTGRILDPIADKIFMTTVLITFTADYRASSLLVTLLIVREIIISGLREILAVKGESSILKVTFLSKIKTTFQFISIILLSLIPIIKNYKENIEYIGSLFLLISTILAIYTGYKYVILVIENKDSLTSIKNE